MNTQNKMAIRFIFAQTMAVIFYCQLSIHVSVENAIRNFQPVIDLLFLGKFQFQFNGLK